MSLNGLEAPEVNEAYQSALGEGGGWFMLKYTTRDEVGLLGRGSGGLVEVQEAVDRYREQSPLFGFIQYRRRKVLLKYIPEGTSRLLQARVTVHFRSVTEKFTSQDTIFSFTKVAELQDSALASACLLHTTTASLKSSNDSIRQPGLAGITEDVSESRVDDAEGPGSVDKRPRISPSRQISPESQTRSEGVKENASAKHIHQKSPSVTTNHSLKRARTTSNVDKALPPIPGEGKGGNISERVLREKGPSESIPNHGDYETRPSTEGRMSSQSARPSARDLYDANGFKQKVKLGPRPSTDSVGRSDKMERHNDFRPVSTLPAGLRMPTRKTVPQQIEPARPQSQQSQRTFRGISSQREKPPTAPVRPIQIPDRKGPVVRNGLLTPAKTPAEAQSSKITPEKMRLMKALQLRQKELAAQKSSRILGIEDIAVGAEYTKPEIDDSILSAITDASNPDADPDLVHVAVKDLSREEARNVESSPISIPETSDGPSTQASSITDEDDIATHDKREDDRGGIPALLSSETPLEVSDEKTLRGSPGGGKTKLHHVPQEVEQSTSARGVGGRSNLPQTKEQKQDLFAVGDRALTEHIDQQVQGEEKPASALAGVPSIGLPSTRKDSLTQFSEDQQEKVVPTSTLPEVAVSHFMTGKASDQKAVMETDDKAAGSEGRQLPEPNVLTSQLVDMLALYTREDNRATSQDSSSLDSHLLPDRGALSFDATSTQRSNGRGTETGHKERKSIHKVNDHIDPVEVPLPSIDEDEEISLSSRQALPRAIPIIDSSAAQVNSQSKLSQPMRQSQDSDVTATRPSTSDTTNEQQAERHIRRRGVVNPPKRLSSPEHSDEQFLSDDSFMEELKSATLQEAKPISVSKSPIKPVFSRTDSDQRSVDTTRATRSVSSPLDQQNNDEESFSPSQLLTPPSTRSFSANQSLRPDSRQTPATIPKKIGVSSGISQRIKALEQLSSRPTSPQSVAPSNTSAFITQRKTSFRSPPATLDLNGNTNNKSRANSAYPSPSPSPEAVKSNPFNNLNQAGNCRPESVSVTATIIRDGKNRTPEIPLNPSEPRPLDLHQSPLVVETQNMAPPPRPLSPLKPPRPRYARYSSARSGSSSSTEQKAEAPQHTRRDSFASMLSRSSRANSEADLPRALSDSSLSGLASRDENRDEKKDSRRSRLMKRMSSISSMSRRGIANALSPSPKETRISERQESIAETPSATVDVGDVNIQFPDTLLWKRRHMIVDERGVLILSPSKSDNNLKVIIKKFPLSEFQPPYIPDQDRQELPNSVILDFKDGSTLQCACEHPQGQASVLQTLREAHSLHQSQ